MESAPFQLDVSRPAKAVCVEFPAPGIRILNDMGYYMHEGGHKTMTCDFEVMADFMDKHFKGRQK